MKPAAPPRPRAAPWLAALAAAGVLAPLFTWHPGALDDVRLDQGVLAFTAFAAVVGLVLLGRRAPVPPPGSLLLLLGLGFGLLPLAFLPWPEAQAGLADRSVLLSAWALASVACASAFDVERLLRWVIAGCGLASAYALLTWVGVDPLGWRPWPEAPPVAPYTGIAHGPELLAPLLVAAAALLPAPRARRADWPWLALAVCAIHAGTFGTLAGRLALAAGLAVAAWRLPAARRGATCIAALFLVGELTRALAAPPAPPPASAATAAPSLAIRQKLYLAAGQRLPSLPLGIGLGRFEADYPKWRSPEEARLANNDWQSRSYRSPKSLHNDPLQLLLECGWLGGALLLAAVLLIFRQAGPWLLAPLAAFGVHALVRAPLLDNPPALALFALLCGCATRAGGQMLAATEPRRSRFTAALLGAGALIALLPARGQIVGEWRVGEALDPAGNDVAGHLAMATEARPWDARAWELRGLGYLAVQEWEFARRCFEHALRHQPTAIGALTGLVQVEMSAPDGDRGLGLELLARAEGLAGRHPAVRAARAGWLDAVAAAHLEQGETRLAERRPEAGSLLLSAALTTARARLLTGDPDAARAALQRAALYAGVHRALVDRIARKAELDEPMVAALTARIFPRWPEDLTAAAPE